MLKKITALLLVFIMAVSAVSCKKGEEDDTDTSDTVSTSDSGSAAPEYLDELKAKYNYSQTVFRIFTINSEIFEQKFVGDLEKDAIYERDLAIEENFGVKVEYTAGATSTMAAEIEKTYMSGSDLPHCVIASATSISPCVQKGYMENLLNNEQINFNSGYWVDKYTENCVFNNGLYFAPTYGSRLLYHAAHAVMFNADMLKEYSDIGNLYDVVRNKEWTLEYMNTVALKVSDGDTSTGNLTRYGICAADNSLYALFGGAGGQYSTLDSKGNIVVDLDDDMSVSILTKICSVFNSSASHIMSNTEAMNSFVAKKDFMWFSMTGMFFDTSVRGASFSFGILPVPMLESGKSYVTPANPTSNYCIAMIGGLTPSDREFGGAMIEIYNYLSYKILRPVKYETVMQYQVSKNADTLEMLNMIFDTLYFDHNLVFNFGKSRDLLGTTVANNSIGSYVSAYQRITGDIEGDIENYIYMAK